MKFCTEHWTDEQCAVDRVIHGMSIAEACRVYQMDAGALRKVVQGERAKLRRMAEATDVGD